MRSEIKPHIVFYEAIIARALPQKDFVKILPDQNGLTAGPLLRPTIFERIPLLISNVLFSHM